ncbi:MAG TPA: TMEM175 family protein, partial [Umezawaea sp.]|nr:TMEM175 family protein [Umezawaea sp.]
MTTTPRDPDRLVLFTDAVVAIAITLLVLPLVDVVTESVAEHHTSVQVIAEHRPEIFSFLLSFVVIAQYWVTHHRMFEGVKAYSRPLTVMNLAWL